jgi:hypothetical protein
MAYSDTTLNDTGTYMDHLESDDVAGRIALISRWFDESIKAREYQADRWRKNERLYFGDHWVGKAEGSTHKTKMVFNFPFSVVESILPIISDFMPTIDVMPRERNDVIFADMMQKRMQQVIESSSLYDKILLAIKDSLIYSNGVIGVLPDMDEEGAFKGFDVEVVDPFTLVPESYATDIDLDNSRYVIFAVPMNVEDIKQQYGVECPAEGRLTEYRAFQVSEEADAQDASKTSDMALIKECYYRDPDVENYPNGRVTIICGEQLLFDAPIEIPRMPYFMLGNYKSPHSFYGVGEPELIRTQTKAINETMSSIADNIKRAGNPSRKITTRAKAKMQRPLTGEPGEEYVVDDPNDVTWESPPPVPAYIQGFVDQIGMMQDSITGVQDVTQGRKPAGVTAASAISALQEAAQTRIRFKITKEITKLIKDIGNYLVEMLQMYDDEIIAIREKDADGQYEFVEYDPNAAYDSEGRSEGDTQFDITTAKTLKDSKFDIEVAAGFRLPSGRVANEERALNLFQLGIYGIEQVADALNEPNKQELIQNFYDRMGASQEGEGGEELPPEVVEQFQALASKASPGSPEEDQLMQLLEQFPQLEQVAAEMMGGGDA